MLGASLGLACAAADERAADIRAPVDAAAAAPSSPVFDSTHLPRVVVGDRALRYEVDSLPELVAAFGGSPWRREGDESGDTRLCYVGIVDGHPASVVFGASTLGGPSQPIAFVVLDRDARPAENGRACPSLAPSVALWTQGHQLALDISVDSLIALLGPPRSRSADTLLFAWERRAPGPYRTIGTQRDTMVEWDVYTHLQAIITNNRVRALHLSHATTY
jgi:hypothetical protein